MLETFAKVDSNCIPTLRGNNDMHGILLTVLIVLYLKRKLSYEGANKIGGIRF